MEPTSDKTITIDHYRGIIHVLDPNKTRSGRMPVSIEEQHDLMHTYGLSFEKKWSWFVYKHNGTVHELVENNEYYIPLSDERVYPAFIGEMLTRINARRFGA